MAAGSAGLTQCMGAPDEKVWEAEELACICGWARYLLKLLKERSKTQLNEIRTHAFKVFSNLWERHFFSYFI